MATYTLRHIDRHTVLQLWTHIVINIIKAVEWYIDVYNILRYFSLLPPLPFLPMCLVTRKITGAELLVFVKAFATLFQKGEKEFPAAVTMLEATRSVSQSVNQSIVRGETLDQTDRHLNRQTDR